MAIYQFLSQKLQKFTVLEFIMVKWVYLIFGILIASLYAPLFAVSGWAYLTVSVIAALPLIAYAFGFNGSLMQKSKQYLKTNNPSHQVLTLISCFFLGLTLSVFFPFLANYPWWIYLLLISLLILKPFTHLFLTK